MKRLRYVLSVLLFLVSLAVPVLPAHAETGNLLANPSVETDGGAGLPANWAGNSWGANTTALAYSTEGHTGSKSLRIDMTAHTDGDAKWMADAVTVNPGTTYTYSSFYKANAATELDLQYTDTAGNVTYAYLQAVAPSTDWTEVTAEFTTPANVAKVVVMHIVAEAGWLQVDDFSLIEKIVLAPPTSGNFVANPSVETANGTIPASWTPTRWGTNTTTLTYAADGHTGGKSLLTNMTAHTDGDAKWMADAVNVTGNTSYIYTGFYKASVATELDLQYTDASGNVTYVYGQAVPASSDWAQTTFTFTTPATATKVVVMHILAQVGTLQTDDFSLTENTTTPPPPTGTGNLFANPSMETANGSSPAGWQSNYWGTLTPQFTYENTGRTGSRSVTTTVTQYTDGDAKWYAEPVNVTAGSNYTYEDYYKSNVTSRVFAAFIDGSGNWSYAALPDAPAAADWAKYTTTVAVPANAAKVTLFHVLDRIGVLTIDDASLSSGSTDPDPDPAL
ncbi:MAG: carbohydrate binding domain-containing protein, partial [Patescibacteria group bacterium]